MTREILFRGKREDTGEWIEGYFLQLHRSERAFIVPKQFVQRGTLRMSGEAPPKIIPIEVIPETVSQFIGLIDRLGKKIFEGDIVNIVTGINGYKSTYSTAIQEVKYTADNGIAVFYPFDNSDMVEVEVIGNIYDNKELLDGKDTD